MTCGNCWEYGWELQLLYCSKTVKLEIFGIIVIKVLIIVEILWVFSPFFPNVCGQQRPLHGKFQTGQESVRKNEERNMACGHHLQKPFLNRGALSTYCPSQLPNSK